MLFLSNFVSTKIDKINEYESNDDVNQYAVGARYGNGK